LILEKIRLVGRLPEDPRVLPIEARLMWQGPFATLDLSSMLGLLGLGALALVPAVRVLVGAERRAHAMYPLACAFPTLSIPVAWLVERTIFLPGRLLPAVGAAAGRKRPGLVLAAVCVQAWICAVRIESTPNFWYRPRERQEEIADLVKRIPALVPDGEAI